MCVYVFVLVVCWSVLNLSKSQSRVRKGGCGISRRIWVLLGDEMKVMRKEEEKISFNLSRTHPFILFREASLPSKDAILGQRDNTDT